MKAVLRSHFASAVLGGLIVGAGFLTVGATVHRRTDTIVVQAPMSAQTSDRPAAGLTAHDIYQRDAPGVVFVRARLVQRVSTPFDLAHEPRGGTSTGSGFLFDGRGDILTDYHVIDGADRVAGVTVEFENAVSRPASVIAVDEADDLAVLRVDMRHVPPVRPLQLGESTGVRVGDPTLTIGNPFGVDRTLTSGIVSALAHQIPGAGGVSVDNVIQTDQAAAAGNAGGPLLDAEGRVIGINSQLAAAGPGDGQRLAFAVPIDTADRLLTRVGSTGSPPVASIGIGGGRPVRGGVTVSGVAPGGPAAAAGIRGGDVIQRVGGAPVGSISDVISLVGTRSPGQSLSVQVRQGRRARTVSVALGRRTSLR